MINKFEAELAMTIALATAALRRRGKMVPVAEPKERKPSLSGGDRNKPCLCGSGLKRKKCNCGSYR
ncbi:hypothetical protein KYLE_13 [Pantoea phage Kyle]|uniref:Uncharacterized protein n=1 Tax=Pantoea phage Kyle TaxID=2589665 RepID=A0A514A8I6_9CAUD|nr:hypothetical protein HWC52_gp013 [Pantoea phage Kyle]QDH49582.1 hypothetical protein KYLE_13 [Pantoea phage Kyle]